MILDLKDFARRYKKTRAFHTPENLQDLILKYQGKAALLVIDAQRQFCDPAYGRGNKETVTVSRSIQSMTPKFRTAGVPVYAVYFSRSGDKQAEDIDFYQFRPEKKDTLVSKFTDSAFHSGQLQNLLKKRKRKLLLVCGFNQAACVKRTVLSAIEEGYDVCLLEDLAGNDKINLLGKSARKQMLKKGTVMTTSKDVLKVLQTAARAV